MHRHRHPKWHRDCRQDCTDWIVTATTDSLVHQIPSLDLTVAGFHHALDPLVHGIDECVVHLLCGLRYNWCPITLKLDLLDIHFTYKVRNMQQ